MDGSKRSLTLSTPNQMNTQYAKERRMLAKEFVPDLLNVHDELLEFVEMVSRSACLAQRVSDKCICFSCEAKRLITKATK